MKTSYLPRKYKIVVTRKANGQEYWLAYAKELNSTDFRCLTVLRLSHGDDKDLTKEAALRCINDAKAQDIVDQEEFEIP